MPLYNSKKYRSICEIGSSDGGNTEKLLQIDQLQISIIDPCVDQDLSNKYKNIERVKCYKGLSLEVLSTMSEKFDCILIDGDHNWYTVFNELQTIRQRNLIKEGGTILLHDVWWPYGRRDLYYDPDNIPVEFRHPYSKKGMVPGKSDLVDQDGKNAHLHNAVFEGGSRNGVLTAVEDFLKEHKSEYFFHYFKIGHGLGFLVRKKGTSIWISYILWFFIIQCYEIAYTIKYMMLKIFGRKNI